MARGDNGERRMPEPPHTLCGGFIYNTDEDKESR